MILPEAKVTIERIGREGEPLVIIDNFTGQPEACAQWGGRRIIIRQESTIRVSGRSPIRLISICDVI